MGGGIFATKGQNPLETPEVTKCHFGKTREFFNKERIGDIKVNGYYLDKQNDDMLVHCCKNSTDKPWSFFNAVWGPHGSCRPGYWACTDGGGFSIEVADEEFQGRFEWFGEDGDPRIKETQPDITDPHFLDKRNEALLEQKDSNLENSG